jgi:mycothiol synthase
MDNRDMSANSEFSFRPFDQSTDLSRIFELRQQVEQHDRDGVSLSMDALRAQLSIPGHDPAKDRCLATLPENPNRVIGYSVIWAGGDVADLQIVVHPDFRRRGLGSALLERILERARQLDVITVNGYAAGSNVPANAFLPARKFIRQGAYSELLAPANLSLPPSAFPSGFLVRPYSEVQDLGILTHAMDDCYKGLWGHNVVDEKQMAVWLPDFIQQGLFLLFAPDGNVVGISRVEVSKDRSERNGKLTGYIDAPGILPEYRNQSLYHPLLLHGMHWLHEQKAELIEMESWGDDPARLKSYESFGFKIVRSQIAYRKRI